MAYKCDILLGRITKISGYEGAVAVKLEKSFIENIPNLESVFLEIDGKPVPFFISDSDYSGADILILKFEGYGSIEKVNQFTGSRVYLTTGRFKKSHKKNPMSLKGYKVLAQNKDLIGIITNIIPNRGQDLLAIISPDKKEILIPLHEDFIVNIDHTENIIVLDLPDGLMDIN
jgi:16S rRNA processing protein RimM